jgi:hypothetical protein
MPEPSRALAIETARVMFETLVPHLIQHGVTSVDAESLLREVSVRECARAYTIRGRRPNVSRVSIRTGLDRHVVAAILKAPAQASIRVRRDAIGRVLDAWRTDLRYVKSGLPVALPIGSSRSVGRTVWSLVRNYAPGIWPRLVIDELLRIGLVEVQIDGRLRCIEPSKDTGAPDLEPRGQLLRDAIEAQLQEMERSVHKRSFYGSLRMQIPGGMVTLARNVVQKKLKGAFAELAREMAGPRWMRRKDEDGERVLIGALMFERPLLNQSTPIVGIGRASRRTRRVRRA